MVAGRLPVFDMQMTAPSQSLVGRVRDRLFPQRSEAQVKPAARNRRELNLRASIAEMLLIVRLRARSRSCASRDVLERGAHVVDVTCKNWFASDETGDFLANPGDMTDA